MFGAAVREGGQPSPALRRRIAYAAAAAALDPGADLFCSGAVGRFGPSEAAVMAEALQRNIDPARLHLDEKSRDTLESVRAATAFAKAGGYDEVVICTDRYHQRRVRMLFKTFGITSQPMMFARDRARSPARLRWRMRGREVLAIPYDLFLALYHRRWRQP